jgi:purine-binding chemotaxis protein CheW
VVDLVKIRKKAKEKRAKELAEAAAAPTPEAESGRGLSADGDAEGGAAHDSAAGAEAASDMPQATTADALARLEAFKERVGRGGDDDAAAVDAAQPSEVQLELLTFLVADETYAIDIEQIVEIVPPRKPTRVPNAQPGVLGIISLRGTIVTVVDVASRLSHAGRPVTPASRMIVVARNGETAAFTVDQVLRVVTFSPHALDFVPAVAGTEHHDYIMGVFRQESDLTILLDIDKVLSA